MVERSTLDFIIKNAKAYQSRWAEQSANIATYEERIREYYVSIEDQIGATTEEEKSAHRRSLERVLRMNPEEVYDLYSTDEASLRVTGTAKAEISEWPKNIVREIIGLCAKWSAEGR